MPYPPGYYPNYKSTSTPTQKTDWGPIIGSVATSILDAASQERTNRANAKNVQAQIDFQREQNATQYQRAVADMKAAGINPALAYKQGGNSSGSGAAAENRAVTFSQAVEAYNQFANGSAQRQLLREQANATSMQARKTQLEGNILQPEAGLGTDEDYRGLYIRARKGRMRADTFLADKTPEQYMANLQATNQGTATARQAAELAKSQTTLNEQQFQNEWFRKNIAPYLNSTARAAKGVQDITDAAYNAGGIRPKWRYY